MSTFVLVLVLLIFGVFIIDDRGVVIGVVGGVVVAMLDVSIVFTNVVNQQQKQYKHKQKASTSTARI